MATYNLGRILPVWKGEWRADVEYTKLDIVYLEGSSYVAVSDNINKRPDISTDTWILVAVQGKKGEPGKDGPTYRAGKGINIKNNVISATESGEGKAYYFGGFGVSVDPYTNTISSEVRSTNDTSTTWNEVQFAGMPDSEYEDWNENNVFVYKGSVYYSAGPNRHYVLSGRTWNHMVWVGFTDFTGEDVYIDSRGVMRYFYNDLQMRYDDSENVWVTTSCNIPNPRGRYMYQGLDGYTYFMEKDTNKQYRISDSSQHTTWEELETGISVDGSRVWNSEDTTYYSDAQKQYYYDYEDESWETFNWRGYREVYGFNVWKQANHIFYSNGSRTYLLENGDTWTLLGSTPDIYGGCVFADGESVYHVYDGDTKQLDVPEIKYETKHGDILATERDVETLMSKIPKFSIKVVQELPVTDISDTTVYLRRSSSATSGNLFDEYIHVDGNWELIGTQNINLEEYAKKSDLPTIPTKVSSFENDANYAQKSDIPTRTSQLTNDSGFLTEHQSLSGFATEEWVEGKGYTNNIGTITEVKINGISVSTSGVANILALPYKPFTTTRDSSATATTWKEIAYTMMPTNNDSGHTQSFAVQYGWGTIAGNLHIGIHVYLGVAYSNFCIVDNASLAGMVKLSYSNTTHRLSIYVKHTANASWNIQPIGVGTDSWLQGENTIVEEPTGKNATMSTINADWNETQTTSPAYINNKPGSKALKVVYEDGTEETVNIYCKA